MKNEMRFYYIRRSIQTQRFLHIAARIIRFVHVVECIKKLPSFLMLNLKFQVLVTYSSTYVLVALSIDRYDAITRPMKFSGSCKYPFIIIFYHNIRYFIHIYLQGEERNSW